MEYKPTNLPQYWPIKSRQDFNQVIVQPQHVLIFTQDGQSLTAKLPDGSFVLLCNGSGGNCPQCPEHSDCPQCPPAQDLQLGYVDCKGKFQPAVINGASVVDMGTPVQVSYVMLPSLVLSCPEQQRTIISSGQTLTLTSGMSVSDILVYGELYISSGATVQFAEAAQGTVFVRGGMLSQTVISGGSLLVSNGGTANSATVDSGGRLHVVSGGLANHITTNLGSMYIFSGATANDITINSDGWLRVSSGAVANSTTVNSGGSVYVSSVGVVSSAIVNQGGRMYIAGGGNANVATVSSGGWLYIAAGGTALAVTSLTSATVTGDGYIQIIN